MHPIKLFNLALAIIALLLLVNIYFPFNTMTGNIAYSLNTEEPKCSFQDREIPIDLCCVELNKQLECTQYETAMRCYVNLFSDNYYILNRKAYDYCAKEGYDVKIK